MKEKCIKDLMCKTKKNGIIVLIFLLVIAVVITIILLFREKKSYRQAIDNNYNMAFYQLIDNVQDVEIYLAKSLITSSPENEAEILSYIWREANLAQTYLSMLPISSSELENTAKFLNQVSDYSYALSHKAINKQELSKEDIDNLEKLHKYSVELKDTLDQLSEDLYNGKISWNELTQDKNPAFSKQVSNISKESFAYVEENFHEYAGLIYDGAFSEHMTNPEHKGLTGEDINEEKAKEKVINLIGKEKIKNVLLTEKTEDAGIESYDYAIECYDGSSWWIAITKKGGHVLSINSNRNVYSDNISDEEASKKAEEFMTKIGFNNMKKTYYTKDGGVETINYAFEQNGVIVYPDLIKIKVALDNGEVLGLESTGYLNSHTVREIPEIKISQDDAMKKINENVEVESIRLAVIPTEYQKEFTCWEIKGKNDERDFLVYINVENGRIEDVLMILNSQDGTITM